MLKPLVVSPVPSHEEIFVSRYDLLLSWALRLTGQQREQAEDLVHDCFIQFTLGCDPASIANLDGYLYVMLKNLHLARIRQAAQFQDATLSVLDYDSAELSLQAVDDIRARMQIQDDLRRVCQYASLRKETSKAGSVLILRFFHGYYPGEIALILKTSRPGVEKRLKLARSEAKLYLEDPARLKFLAEPKLTKMEPNRASRGETTIDFLRDLRNLIFQSRQGECLSSKRLKEIYSVTDTTTDAHDLAHLVSCASCLDQVNNILGLAPLSDRYPTDMLGPDTRSQDQGGGPQGGGGSRTPTGGDGRKQVALKRYRRGVKQIIEHAPKELRIAVNGFLLGSQRVSARFSEQALSVKGEERIGFVEIFSEQRVRLLFLSVEPPPDGQAEQSLRVSLSEGRTLDVALKFGTPWPTLQVIYQDPSLQAESGTVATEDFTDAPAGEQVSIETKAPEKLSQRSLKLAGALLKRIFAGFWFRPATITAIVTVLLIAVVIVLDLRHRVPTPVTATELLSRSVAAEEVAAGKRDQVLHRTINLEERSSTAKLIAQRRIEVWQSFERGVTTRRLYDEHGQLIAGEWRRADGTRTIYHHRSQPQPTPLSGLPAGALDLDNVWLFELSAKDFGALIGNPEAARVEETPATYIVSLTRTSATEAQGLTRATLVLNRDDLHARELLLLVEHGGDTREYRFTETSFERRPASAVAPAVFDSDPDLLSSSGAGTRSLKPETTTPATERQPVTPVLATAGLEVEVLRLLNGAGADLGEQVNVMRNPGGQLRVEGIVETEERKRELLRALSSVASNPAVKIEISTVAEALARQRQNRTSSPATVEPPEITANTIPVDNELRHYLTGKGIAAGQIDEEIRRYASRMRDRSQDALMHGYALKRLVNRFSADDLRTLDSDARSKWLALIGKHAQALQRETQTIRQGLQPIFSPGSTDGSGEGFEIRSDADLTQGVERLFDLCSSNDKVIRSAFSISPDPSRASAIRTPQFWGSLKSLELLAARMQSLK